MFRTELIRPSSAAGLLISNTNLLIATRSFLVDTEADKMLT